MGGELSPFTAERVQRVAEASRMGRQSVPPPYHTYDLDLLYLVCRFDPVEARKAMPAPLELHDDGLGVIMLYTAPRGWIIAPFSACVATLHVKGYDQPDKFPSNFIHTAFYSGATAETFRHVFNDRVRIGSASIDIDDDGRLSAQAGVDGADAVRVSARSTNRRSDEIVGVNTYLTTFGNGIQTQTTSYSSRFRDLEDVSIEILDTAPEPLRRLRPLEVVWPIRLDGMAMTFNAPRPLDELQAANAVDVAQAAVFDLLRKIGRAAVLVTRRGRPIFVTPEAEVLLGAEPAGLIATPRLFDRQQGDPTSWRGTARLGEPVVVEHPPGRPLVLQMLPMLPGVADEPVMLMLISDPRAPAHRNPEPLLQMLGLTRAEARLAARVGRGQPPQSAASDLGITRQTARTTLKLVFEKLEVSRQAQLAQFVSRLDAV